MATRSEFDYVLPPERIAVRSDDHEELAEQLFTLLMGEPHRRRMFGMDPAPSAAAAAEHVTRTLKLVLTS